MHKGVPPRMEVASGAIEPTTSAGASNRWPPEGELDQVWRSCGDRTDSALTRTVDRARAESRRRARVRWGILSRSVRSGVHSEPKAESSTMSISDQAPGEKRKSRTQFRATEYLLNFGDGPVPGRIHTNPDGSVGGLVADTAEAEDSVVIEKDAKVFGNARVFGASRIEGTARVYGNTRVDDSVIGGAAQVHGNVTVDRATVTDRARVMDDAGVGAGARVGGNAVVRGGAKVMGDVVVDGDAVVEGTAWIAGGHVTGSAVVRGSTVVRAGEVIDGS